MRTTTTQPFHRQQVIRLVLATASAAFAAGYLVADLDTADAGGLARTVAAVAALTLVLWIAEIRITRHVTRVEAQQAVAQEHIEEHLRTAEYCEGYVDGIQRRPPGEGRHLHSV